ncbi:hypothetical protein [Williamsoniiplasma lucivorax]|uniref:Uncharacterized protein n=1 Tax=Williamsoniiplasma lucivorax TaxID=209274 RepID=A0A2S5RDM0_9MOLU|nr:hypothetical protein [Williamsoniiplasma lucivorax]PPE05410.1 hypothetical protein ELUCI_v1c05020 [Williamsoniiplasma lucivorax]
MDNFVNLELNFLWNHGKCVFPDYSCKHIEKKKCRYKIIVLKLIDESENKINKLPLYYKLTSKANLNEPKNSWLKLNDYMELENIFNKPTFIRAGKKEEDFHRDSKNKLILPFPNESSQIILSFKIQRDILDLFLNERVSSQLDHLSESEEAIINQKLLYLEKLIDAAIEYEKINFNNDVEEFNSPMQKSTNSPDSEFDL